MLELFVLVVLVAALFAFFGAARLLFAILLLPLKLAFWLLLLPFQLVGWLFLAIVCLPLAAVGFALVLAIGLPLLVVGVVVGGICLALAAVWAIGSLLFG
jgi:hypothetical protein